MSSDSSSDDGSADALSEGAERKRLEREKYASVQVSDLIVNQFCREIPDDCRGGVHLVLLVR